MNLTDVLPGTLEALRLIRATVPRGRRMPEAFYGPSNQWLRKQIIELVSGKKPLAMHCGYHACRDLLIKALGATGNCIAVVDADLEARATALLDVPAAQNGSPPTTESGEAKNPPPQAMAKIKPTAASVPDAIPVKPEANGAPPPAETNGKPANKTTCPITREQFRQHAKPMTITIGGKSFVATPKEFSTGSLGWNLNEKDSYTFGEGGNFKVQIGMNITLVGSKDLPK